MLYRHGESTGGYILEQVVSVRAVSELIVREAGREAGAAVDFFSKGSSPFAYHWPDNVKVYK